MSEQERARIEVSREELLAIIEKPTPSPASVDSLVVLIPDVMPELSPRIPQAAA